MSAIKDRVTEDMKQAMRAKQAERLSAIRMLLAAIKQKEIDERIELSDAQVLGIIEKLTKQRKDSISQFEAAGRQDLADKEKAELGILSAYMPEQADPAEVVDAIEAAITASGAAGPQDMGKVMAILRAGLAGRADIGVVSALVKQRLSKA
jgi:uncharacterized protein